MALVSLKLRPKLLLLAVAVSSAWILFFVAHFRGYSLPEVLNFSAPVQTSANTTTSSSHTDEATTTPLPRVLLVSAVYSAAKEKTKDYDRYLNNFLQTVDTDLYIYTTPDLLSQIDSSLSPSRRNGLTFNITFPSPSEIPPLLPWKERYTKMRNRYHAKAKHTPELYAFSNARPYFVDQAVKDAARRGKQYDFVFWTDPTSFHQEQHHYRHWPSPSRLKEIWDDGAELAKPKGAHSDDLIFFPIWNPPNPTMRVWNEHTGPLDSKFTQGNFFGGSPKAMDWFARAFYTHHDGYARYTFVGKEQALINAMALIYPSRFITVWYNDPEAPVHQDLIKGSEQSTPRPVDQSFLGRCSSEWFYYQFFLSDSTTRAQMQDQWLTGDHPWRDALLYGWMFWRAKDKTPCQLTRVLSLEDALKRQFGNSWSARPTAATVPEQVSWS